jgi:hypothetical protein
VIKPKYLSLTLPPPAKGEGNHIEIEKKFPPPGRGKVWKNRNILPLPSFSRKEERGNT